MDELGWMICDARRGKDVDREQRCVTVWRVNGHGREPQEHSPPSYHDTKL